MYREQELLEIRAALERQLAEVDRLAEELGAFSFDTHYDGAVLADELRRVKEQQRQLRVLRADCERQLQR